MPPVAQPAIKSMYKIERQRYVFLVGKCLAAHFQLASLILSNESEDREGGSFGKKVL